jgi:acid phosphatase (class A)
MIALALGIGLISTLYSEEKLYVVPGEMDVTMFISPPPATNSPKNRAELDEILAFQSNRTQAMVDFAVSDATISVFRFADVIGTNFTPANFPVAAYFFSNSLANAEKITSSAKKYYHRPRPYAQDTNVHPCVPKPSNESYPSGHSTAGNFFAILLADMLPEKAGEIYARGWRFAENRVIGGAHFRSDIEAGRICAALIAEKMFESAAFQRDFKAAKEEIRKAYIVEK